MAGGIGSRRRPGPVRTEGSLSRNLNSAASGIDCAFGKAAQIPGEFGPPVL